MVCSLEFCDSLFQVVFLHPAEGLVLWEKSWHRMAAFFLRETRQNETAALNKSCAFLAKTEVNECHVTRCDTMPDSEGRSQIRLTGLINMISHKTQFTELAFPAQFHSGRDTNKQNKTSRISWVVSLLLGWKLVHDAVGRILLRSRGTTTCYAEPGISRTCHRLGNRTFFRWFPVSSQRDEGWATKWTLERDHVPGRGFSHLSIYVSMYVCIYPSIFLSVWVCSFWHMQKQKEIIAWSNLSSPCWEALCACVLSFRGHLCDIETKSGECRWKEEMEIMDWSFNCPISALVFFHHLNSLFFFFFFWQEWNYLKNKIPVGAFFLNIFPSHLKWIHFWSSLVFYSFFRVKLVFSN